ncbi:hypothetical protein EB796_008340 [Bugula neritina]|uniref:Uncharacterized protein n=1 Tax=Bugula neritina TaxID=10212 RepID=A0A7J7K408_BUGNE|nr:hypothetical protein EB796_008340 [Bugula neritina]
MEVKEVSSESHVLTHCYAQTVCIRGTFSAGNHAKGLIQILPVNVTDFAEGEIRDYVFGKQKEVDSELAKYPKRNASRNDNGPNGEEDSVSGGGSKPGSGSGKPGSGSGGGSKPRPGSGGGSKPGPGSGGGGQQKPSSGGQGSGGGDGKDISGIQSELDNELKYSRDRTEVAHGSHSGSEQICSSQILLTLMVMFFFQIKYYL